MNWVAFLAGVETTLLVQFAVACVRYLDKHVDTARSGSQEQDR